jgi:hypothetical protein
VILHLGFWPRIFIGIIDKVSFSFGMYVGWGFCTLQLMLNIYFSNISLNPISTPIKIFQLKTIMKLKITDTSASTKSPCHHFFPSRTNEKNSAPQVALIKLSN